eukprot:856002_1
MLFNTIVWALCIVNKAFSQLHWTRSETPNPLIQARDHFVGHSDGRFYIIGGFGAGTRLNEYDSVQETYTNIPNNFSFGSNTGQSSTQIDNTLYMLPDSSASIILFNLDTKSITNISFPGRATKYRCMTHWNRYLFITGGKNATTSFSYFLVYDMTKQEWLSGTALPQPRVIHTCNVVNDKLYMIGGAAGGAKTDGIIMIRLNTTGGCCNGKWITINGTLYTRKSEHRSVVWNNVIYAAGGLDGYADVDIIQTDTGEVYRDSQMYYAKRRQGMVQANGEIFVFGGIPSANIDYYQHAVIPTVEPTASPTDATVQPTHTPTTATTQPTPNTFLPTVTPTKHPSLIPTIRTDAPTISPTNQSSAPTLTPFIPSAAPTQSPTPCLDFAVSNDGNGDRDNITLELSRFFQTNLNFTQNGQSVQIHSNQGFGSVMECNGTSDICHIQCSNTIAESFCTASSVVATNINLLQLVIECDGQGACFSMIVNISSHSINTIDIVCNGFKSCLSMNIALNGISTDSVYVKCSGVESCKSMEMSLLDTTTSHVALLCSDARSCEEVAINVKVVDNGQLSLHCMGKYSCNSMSIELQFASSSVICYDDYSCNGVALKSSGDVDMQIDFVLHKFSANVQIIHPKQDMVTITCGNPEDQRFIRYEMDQILSEEDVMTLARAEYDSLRMPCEGVSIDCTTDEKYPKSCDIEYAVNPLNLSRLLSLDTSNVTCYQVELSSLFTPFCSGSCSNTTFYVYNISLLLDVNFNVDNQSHTELYLKCDTFFGSDNSTLETFAEIDAIFENVFSYFDRTIIHNVLGGPVTEFGDKLFLLDCNTTRFEMLKFMTNISIESEIDNEKAFNQIFDPDGEFIGRSEKLLSKLFGLSVTIIPEIIQEIIPEITTIVKGLFEVWQWILIVIAAALLVLVIAYCLYKYCRKRKWMEVRNPFIIPIAIGRYDENPENPEFEGYLSNLDGIDHDIRNTVELFAGIYNYDVFPNYRESIQQEWTRRQILNLLYGKAEYLANNIPYYDGLVVIISSHGLNDAVLTSDYKTIKKSDIHRIFSKAKDENTAIRDIPRLFVFDCCDGSYAQEIEDRQSIMEENKDKPQNNDVKYEVIKKDDSERLDHRNEWAQEESNPDHKLVLLHAANKNFQSKLRTDIGSLFIERLLGKIRENENIHWLFTTQCWRWCKNKQTLWEITSEIQHELHDEGKQLPEYKYNNDTERIVFIKNQKEKAVIDDSYEYKYAERGDHREIELAMIPINNDGNVLGKNMDATQKHVGEVVIKYKK